MNRTHFKIAAALAFTLSFGIAAEAGPVTLTTNTWVAEPFTLMNPGNTFPDAYTASTTGDLLITGYYITGDYYNVYVNSNLALTTMQVKPTDIDFGDRTPSQYSDPASAFTSGFFSTGRVKVNKGDTITITDLYPPSGIGEVAVQQVTPEPASYLLLPVGLLATLLLRKTRRPIS